MFEGVKNNLYFCMTNSHERNQRPRVAVTRETQVPARNTRNKSQLAVIVSESRSNENEDEFRSPAEAKPWTTEWESGGRSSTRRDISIDLTLGKGCKTLEWSVDRIFCLEKGQVPRSMVQILGHRISFRSRANPASLHVDEKDEIEGLNVQRNKKTMKRIKKRHAISVHQRVVANRRRERKIGGKN